MMTVVMMVIIVINIIFISTNHSGTTDRGRSLENVAVAFLQPEIPGSNGNRNGDDDGNGHDDDDDDDSTSTTRNTRRAIKSLKS